MVNLKQDIKPISYIKSHAADMMKYVNEVKSPIVITQNGEAKAVLLDVDTYQTMTDAFNLLKILQKSEEDLKSGNYKPQAQVFSEIEDRFGFGK